MLLRRCKKIKVKIMDNAYSIRLSCEDDFDAIEEIEHQVFSNPWPPEAFSRMLFPWAFTLLYGKEVIGYIFYCGVKEEMVIVNFAVKPDFQGKGLGEYLLTETMRMMNKNGVQRFYLDVRISNYKARRLYEKVGFQEIGIRKQYYNNPDEDALVMGMEFNDIRV